MSTDVELSARVDPEHGAITKDAEVPRQQEEAGGSKCGDILVLVLLSPFLLVLFLILGLVWLVLLPFRSCMHHHGSASGLKPAPLPTDEPVVGGGTRGDWFFSERGNTWLFYRHWIPDGKLRGVVYLAHGFGEHISRAGYFALAQKLNEAGLAMLALDHQGHGRSTGDRAFYANIDDIIDDYIDFMHLPVDRITPDVPRFILGHSMGGLIALSAAVKSVTPEYRAAHPSAIVRGVVLSAPCLAIDPKLATPPLKLAAKILSAIVPKLALSGLPATLITRSPAAVAAYEADPLIWHGGARARVGAEMLREMSAVLAQLHSFDLPILLCHGTKDQVVPIVASSLVYSGVASKDKQFLKYDGLFHEMMEDEEADRVLTDIQQWLQRHADETTGTAAVASPATNTAPTPSVPSDPAPALAPVSSPVARASRNGSVSRSTGDIEGVQVQFHDE